MADRPANIIGFYCRLAQAIGRFYLSGSSNGLSQKIYFLLVYFIEVTTRQHETEFLELPVRLYKGNPWWIRPLDNDIRNVFDPAKNPCFQNGECIRWILKDETGQCVGRVAAFINRKTCHLDKYSVGQMGFFECIDDRQAAFCLFVNAGSGSKEKVWRPEGR